MKVIFLDIDGVLNHHNFLGDPSLPVEDEDSLVRYANRMLDAECIWQLNRILKATGAVVVLSSTWRAAHPILHVNRMLRYRGFEGYLFGATPELDYGYRTPAFHAFLEANPEHIDATRRCRGNEIQAWLDLTTEVERFVILDDDSDMGHLLPLLVRTSYAWGLTTELADQAIEILNGPNSGPAIEEGRG